MNNENYVTILTFMLNEPKPQGTELMVYAIIYSFTPNNQKFSGSLKYLADWTSSSKQGVMKNLKSLCEKGYIRKNELFINGVKLVEYYATEFNGGMQLGLPNNTNNNTSNNTRNINILCDQPKIPPSIEDVQKYIRDNRLNVDASRFMDYYESNGWKVGKAKMKDWQATLRNWNRRNEVEKPKNEEWDYSRFEV